ncbi:MAG TPA: AarF/ABC1/UbiB kinase family protein [Coriobacteriia bacterium]|nr:AarF/ABC1/UbiB kinase family protein [Coriobacteriia bacterium]
MATISRSQRYRRIVSVLVDEGFGTVLDQLGLRAPWIANLRGNRAKGPDANLMPEERVRRTMEHLGPTFAKIGQMLSVRPDLIPASYADELAKLQDEMVPFPFAQARAEIEESFGEPLDALYATFEEEPAAAASIGQVHMATLLDGTRVAVKVQRPGIRDVIEADLDILRTQARRIHGRTDIGVRYDVVGLVDEFSRVLHEECDYVREGENAERLATAFEGDTTVHFPKVYWDRTSSTVLTMERIEGIGFNRLDELDAHGVDRREIARRGITCYYEQIFIHGFYHADPHPGNLFAMPDGRVAFTDFGRAGKLSDEARAQVADLLVAIIEQDGELAGDILLEVSRGVADVDAIGLKRDVTALIAKYYNMRLREVDTRALIVEVMSLIGKRGLSLSSEFALLLTTLATIQALGTAIDPDFHFVESVTPFARRIVEEQVQPTSIAKGFIGTMRKSMRAFQGFPDNVNRALKRVADGDLRMTVRPGGFDPLMSRVEQAIDRLAFALVVSAFVLGFSWLLAPTQIPWWLELIAGFTLVCSAGVGVWFFLSIMLRRWRQRRHEY